MAKEMANNTANNTAKELPKDEPKRWLDERRNIDKVFWSLVAICAALVVADFLYEHHGHFGFEDWPVFYGVFGFLAYVGLVMTATQLRKLLKRGEDYYDD